MEPVESLVYLTIWAALACYPAGPLARAIESSPNRRRARFVWTAGCVLFWIHAASAFGAFYGWSHATAVAETARETLDATGFESGFGIYLNYLFALLWAADVAWAWGWPNRYTVRPVWVWRFALLHGFFLFLIVNGAVVFVDGWRRWLGFALFLAAVGSFAWSLRRGLQSPVPRQRRPERDGPSGAA